MEIGDPLHGFNYPITIPTVILEGRIMQLDLISYGYRSDVITYFEQK